MEHNELSINGKQSLKLKDGQLNSEIILSN